MSCVSAAGYYLLLTVTLVACLSASIVGFVICHRKNFYNIIQRVPAINKVGSHLKNRFSLLNGPEKTYPWEIDHKQVKFKKKLAKGNFGEVWLATWLGSAVAAKTVLSSMARDAEFIERFVLEIKLMSTLHHPNVVMFLGACIKPVESMCLILEYCVGGNLHEFISRNDDKEAKDELTLHQIIKFTVDIARGVHYIHQKKNIIQRDLKSRNVLVDGHLNAKVADFGLSRLNEDSAGMTACGTPAWTAPEIVKMEPYDEKVDVYSFGIVLWECMSREEPYDGQGGVQIAYAAAEQGLRPPVPKYCPNDYKDLMVRCWDDNPKRRPDFGLILEVLFKMMKSLPNPTMQELEWKARYELASEIEEATEEVFE